MRVGQPPAKNEGALGLCHYQCHSTAYEIRQPGDPLDPLSPCEGRFMTALQQYLTLCEVVCSHSLGQACD